MDITRALILSLFIFLNTAISEDSKKSTYKIGVICPLSGDGASIGKYYKQAVNLAHQSLPQDKGTKIEIFFEDDQFQATKTVTAYQSLRSMKDIDAVMVLGSSAGHAIAPLAEQDKVLMVAVGASDKTIVEGKKYTFIHWVSPEAEAKKMVQEIKKRDYKRIAMIMHEQQGVIAFEKALMDELKEVGEEKRIILKNFFAMDNKDFSSFIVKARSLKADAINVALFQGGLSTLASKVREAGITSDIFGAEMFEDENEVAASKGALIGAWYVNSDSFTDEFIAEYKKAFNEYPGITTANAYDVIKLIHDGISKNGTDNIQVADYLRNVKDYSGAAGKYSATNDNRFDLKAATKVVTKDGFQKLN